MSVSLDVILVKYGNHAQWIKTLEQVSLYGNVLTRDNSYDNIGLVKARIELINQSSADYILLMDYDFISLDVKIDAMMAAGYPISQPGNGGKGWQTATRFPCNFMLIERESYEYCGGLDPAYHTAYADWDLINRMAPVMQHNPSTVKHIGSPSTPEKRAIWSQDWAIYNEKWQGRLNG